MHYWLTNVRIETGYRYENDWVAGTESKTVAIEVMDGNFSQIIDQNLWHADGTSTVIDGQNQLLLPGLVEKHCHLDKSKLGTAWRPVTPAATLVERFESEIPQLDALPITITQRATNLIKQELATGTTQFRSHIDIEPMTELRYFDAIQTLRTHQVFPIELVAFPQHGLLRSHASDLVEVALQRGATFIGGVDPYSLDGDYQASLAETFRLATKYHAGIDIHVHDRGVAGTMTIREIISLTAQHQLQDQVFISHAFGLNDFTSSDRVSVFAELAKLKIHIVSSVPLTNNTLPPIKELLQAGVPVHLGCDNVYDSWSPYGDASLQQKLARLGEILGVKDQIDLTQLLGLVTDGLVPLTTDGKMQWPAVGMPATYLLTPADCTAEFVARQTPITQSAFAGNSLLSPNF